MGLKFFTSKTKGLKIELRDFLGLIPIYIFFEGFIYICITLLQHALLCLWVLVHFDTSIHDYIYLAFKKTKSPEFITRAPSIIDMEEKCELKIYAGHPNPKWLHEIGSTSNFWCQQFIIIALKCNIGAV